MDKTAKRRKADKRRLRVIIALLLLCVAAAVYILLHFGRSGADDPGIPAEDTSTEESTEISAEDEEAIAAGKAASHVYSHRGSQGDDELTFAAYDRAIEAGSKFIEADIVVSGSGTIYLAHDDHALEMTGYDGYFSGMTDAQISELRTKAGNNIVKLSELFGRYGDSVTYLIDIKYASSRNITAFTEIVREYGLEENVIAASFYFNALKPLEDTFPDMTKLIICTDQETFDVALGLSYVDIICVPKEMMTADNLGEAHSHEKGFSVWTLNTEEEIREAIELGVDSYFTDDSGLAIRLEKELRSE